MATINQEILDRMTQAFELNNQLLAEIRKDFDQREKLLENQQRRGRLWLIITILGILVVGAVGGGIIMEIVDDMADMSKEMQKMSPDMHEMAGYMKTMSKDMQSMSKDMSVMSTTMGGMGKNFDTMVVHMANMDNNFNLMTRQMGVMTNNVGNMRYDMNVMRRNMNDPIDWMRNSMEKGM